MAKQIVDGHLANLRHRGHGLLAGGTLRITAIHAGQPGKEFLDRVRETGAPPEQRSATTATIGFSIEAGAKIASFVIGDFVDGSRYPKARNRRASLPRHGDDGSGKPPRADIAPQHLADALEPAGGHSDRIRGGARQGIRGLRQSR
jgi:hypothetical protein